MFESKKYSNEEQNRSIDISLDTLTYYFNSIGQSEMAASIQNTFIFGGYDKDKNIIMPKEYENLARHFHFVQFAKKLDDRIFEKHFLDYVLNMLKTIRLRERALCSTIAMA